MWRLDARLVFGQRKNTDKLGDLLVVDLNGRAEPRPLFVSSESEFSPRLAPGGRFVAYRQNDRDEYAARVGELAVVSFPDGGTRTQVTSGGFLDGWGWLNPNDLYWLDPVRRAWSATITMRGGRLDVSPAQPLFGGKAFDEKTSIQAYSPARDRFLISRVVVAPDAPSLVVVSDWRAVLKGE